MIAQADALHRTLGPAVVNDPPLKAYLQQISGRLLAAAREVAKEQSMIRDGNDWMFSKEVQFHVVQCGVPNAFTSGGHQVYLTTAGLERLASEEELAELGRAPAPQAS